jgi:hypothetical protein
VTSCYPEKRAAKPQAQILGEAAAVAGRNKLFQIKFEEETT